MFLTNLFFQPLNSNLCSSENSRLLPCCATPRLNKRLTALSIDSSTEGDPCLLGETLHLWFPWSSSAVSSRLPMEQHPRRFQVTSPPKNPPNRRENFWCTYKSTSPMAHKQKSFFKPFLKNKVPTLLKRPPTSFFQEAHNFYSKTSTRPTYNVSFKGCSQRHQG